MAYYEEVFGATDIKRLLVNPQQASSFDISEDEASNATMYSNFEIAGTTILASVSFGKPFAINESISLLIGYDINNEADVKEVEALYDRVKDHGTINVEMPLEEQFCDNKMGAFTDKYNVR
ncbi:VOC family protein [Staphylococcus kloosii]|uniref:VOC family protein n=1 Tax=Staphylococcus kloosii TaxID=29384 RepID=UPI0028A35FEA|nr:VOC family protein [Staphylococcus kloosii]MDT3959849.1 VOC family protein [Staphylococcus kloosii]